MHPEIAERFAKLEERRKALVERVRALSAEKQTAHSSPKEFSPVEVLMHIALAEKFDLDHLESASASSLVGRRAKPSFIYRHAVHSMSNAKRIPTMASMTPEADVTLAQTDELWENVRIGLAKHFVKVKNPDDAFMSMKFMGTLSASDLLTLFEAHTHYHEARFPG